MSKLKLSAQEGRALALALVALAIGCLLIPPFLSYISTNLFASIATEEGMREQYAADAGVEYAVWKLINDPNFRESLRWSTIDDPVPVDMPTSVNAITPTVSVANRAIPNSWPGRWGGQGTGGEGWAGNNYQDVYFMNNEVGWIVGDFGRIMKTLDGGYGWVKLRGQSIYPDLYSVSRAITDTTQTWTVGKKQVGGTIWYIDDEEETVHEISDAPNQDFNGVFFVDDGNGWAVGTKGTILHYDGFGWGTQTSGTNKTLNDVYFVDEYNGWAVGEGGTILHYNGTTWAAQTSGTTENLNDVYFLDQMRGWAVGENGTILKTWEGGASWVQQTSIDPPTNIDFNGVAITVGTQITGWVVGELGHIRKMTHSISEGWGATDQWGFVDSGTASWLNSVHFTDEMHGWAVGDGWTVLIYACDGGECAWFPPNRITDKDLNAVWFANDFLHGWTVGNKTDGDDWVIGGTEDATTWITKTCSITNTQNLSGISFTSVYSEAGWAVGANGTILKSSDGGETWEDQSCSNCPSGVALNAVYAISPTLAYAVGDSADGYGYIITTTNGNNWSRWEDTGLPEYHLYDISFAYSSSTGWTGWAVGKDKTAEKGQVVKITHAESNPVWEDQSDKAQLDFGIALKALHGVCVLNSILITPTVWAVGDTEAIIVSKDGGSNWYPKGTELPSDAEFRAVHFPYLSTGCIVGTKHQTAEEKDKTTILKTYDGGETWHLIETGTGRDLYDIFVKDECNAWAVGEKGVIVHFFCPDIGDTGGCGFFDIKSVANDLSINSRVHLCLEMHIDSWEIK